MFGKFKDVYVAWVNDRDVNVYTRAATILFLTVTGISSVLGVFGFFIWLLLLLPEIIQITIITLTIISGLVWIIGVVIKNTESH